MMQLKLRSTIFTVYLNGLMLSKGKLNYTRGIVEQVGPV